MSKVAIVTGGARNIGREVALALAEDGFDIYLHSAADTEVEAQSTSQEIKALGRRAEVAIADFSDTDSFPNLVQDCVSRFGGLDVLVNNAGLTGRRAPVLEHGLDDYRLIFDVNFFAPFQLCQQALAVINQGGSIINFSSSTVHFPAPDLSLYGASKAALKYLTEALVPLAGARGATINSVLPGPVTPGVFDAAPQERKIAIAEASPFKRLGTPQDIAGVVRFLASDNARWVTGQSFVVNGGSNK